MPARRRSSADGIASGIRSLSPGATARVLTPLGREPARARLRRCPCSSTASPAGDELVALVTLTGGDAGTPRRRRRNATATAAVAVTWPDGLVTTSRLTDPRTADGADR